MRAGSETLRERSARFTVVNTSIDIRHAGWRSPIMTEQSAIKKSTSPSTRGSAAMAVIGSLSAPAARRSPFRRGGGEWEWGQAASFSLVLALIIAAPFSAIMIVGALVFVELTAGIAEASMIRSASSP
jgi:hypothetical protein